MTKEELDVLYAKAQRDQKNPPQTPSWPSSPAGQEATERNTRNVAKDIEDKIEGAGAAIAQDLVRAAGKMGYAIVDLRDKKLASAYNPHQVEALNALEQAPEKGRGRPQGRPEETGSSARPRPSRRQLEKIRIDQTEQVNKPTTEIDNGSASPTARSPAQHAVRLNQLPGKEGELSKTHGRARRRPPRARRHHL